MAEQMLEMDGVQLCVDTFGSPPDPSVLLIAGGAQSMVWWEDEFCARLAAARRFVVRYDHRDTGRSTSSPAGQPSYTAEDLARGQSRRSCPAWRPAPGSGSGRVYRDDRTVRPLRTCTIAGSGSLCGTCR